MENQIAPEIKEKRSKKLIELSDRSGEKRNKQYIGKQVEVLWEEEKEGKNKGHTTNYMLVEQEKQSAKPLENTIEKVEIEKADKFQMIAKKEM